MVDLGHRLKNLEEHTSYGIALVLGTKLPESYWTKILPKSGDKFDLFVDRLRAIGLFDLTREFAPVYRSLMEWSLAHMDDLTESDTSTANVPEVTASRFVSTGDQSADSYITEWRSMYHFDSPGGSGLV